MFEKEISCSPVVVFVPLTSVPRFSSASSWYMVRYVLAGEWVELYMVSRVDAIGLAIIMRDLMKISAGVWYFSTDGVFALEEAYV